MIPILRARSQEIAEARADCHAFVVTPEQVITIMKERKADK